jgi:hypothetical protein
LVARHLIEETGTELENQHATEFRCSILTGDWSKAIAALENLRPEINRDEKVQVRGTQNNLRKISIFRI